MLPSRKGGIRAKSQVPRGRAAQDLRVKGGVWGWDAPYWAFPVSPSFTFSLTTCVEPSCLDTCDAAPVLTATGCPISRKTNQSPRFPVTKSPPTRPTLLLPRPRGRESWGREPSSCCSRGSWSWLRPGLVSAESGGNGLCGEGRGDLLGAGVRGQYPMKERPPRPCPDLLLSPVRACPSLAYRPLFSSPSGVRARLRLLPSRWPYAPSSLPGPSPRTRDPRREEIGPGLTPPRPQAPTP